MGLFLDWRFGKAFSSNLIHCLCSRLLPIRAVTHALGILSKLSQSVQYARFEMFEVSVAAQQGIVDALKPCNESSQTVVLCHTPSEICTDGYLTLGTHDLLDDCLGKESLSLIVVFPNMGVIKQVLKNHKDDPFTIDCIVACHHSYDPLDVSFDVVGRLGLDFQNVSQIAFVVDLPKGTYRSYATSAYRIRVQSDPCTVINILWKRQQEQFDELLIPKFLVSHEEINNIINNLDGPLKRHSSKRNSLFDLKVGRIMIPSPLNQAEADLQLIRRNLNA